MMSGSRLNVFLPGKQMTYLGEGFAWEGLWSWMKLILKPSKGSGLGSKKGLTYFSRFVKS